MSDVNPLPLDPEDLVRRLRPQSLTLPSYGIPTAMPAPAPQTLRPSLGGSSSSGPMPLDAQVDPQSAPPAGRLRPPSLGGGTPAPIPVKLPDPAAPEYSPLHGFSRLAANLSELAGVPTKSGLEPLEGVRRLGEQAIAEPGQRYQRDLAAAKTGIEAQTAQSEGALRTAQTGLTEAEAEKTRREMGLPKPVTGDKSTFTGPNNEKLSVDAYEIGGKRVYAVTGAGAPTANSPTTAEGALQEYLGKKNPAPIQPSGGLTPPTLGGAPPLPMAPADPMRGWTAGEPTPEQRPAGNEELQGMRDTISASGIAPDEKAALLKELRPGMTTKELDTLSARYENAAGRVSAADIANKNRQGAQTAEQEDARYEKIQTALSMKQQVSPADKAWAASYEKRKTLGPAASSAAADTRQQNAQDFAQKEAGRKYLTEKVEQPYRDSVEKAETLRGMITGARAGNKVDANMISLVTALTVTTTEGVKRINAYEIGAAAQAGNLLDRIRSWSGKIKAGDPVPEDLKKDTEALANLLQQGAYSKYKSGFDTATKRYGLTDETPLPGPGGGANAPAPGSAGKPGDPLGIL